MRLRERFAQPSAGLIASIALVQVLCIAVPNLWSVGLAAMVSGGMLVAGYALFSPSRTLLVALMLNVVLPVKMLFALKLPGGLRLQEGIALAACLFALIDLVYRRGLRLRVSAVDVPVLCFLGATLFSVAVGFAHGHWSSQILRDMRYPLYYGLFFLVTNFVDRRAVLNLFAPALVLCGVVVGVEYILEFLGAIDLSVGTRFVRVVRLHGLILPLAILLVANQFIHNPGRYSRLLLVSMLLPIGLAFVLTVGRGMWICVGVGLLCSGLLRHFSLPREERSAWKPALLVVGILVVVVGTAVVFQRFTGAAIGAHAFERSLTFVDYQRDTPILARLLSYVTMLESIAMHPLLGHGQGATINILSIDPDTNLPEMIEAATIDSLYLALWWKMGLFGLCAFVWLYLRVLHTAWASFKTTRDQQVQVFSAGAVAVLMGMGVLGLSDASVVTSRFALVFASFFGMVVVVARGDGDAQAN
jgi:hypothetical protein